MAIPNSTNSFVVSLYEAGSAENSLIITKKIFLPTTKVENINNNVYIQFSIYFLLSSNISFAIK